MPKFQPRRESSLLHSFRELSCVYVSMRRSVRGFSPFEICMSPRMLLYCIASGSLIRRFYSSSDRDWWCRSLLHNWVWSECFRGKRAVLESLIGYATSGVTIWNFHQRKKESYEIIRFIYTTLRALMTKSMRRRESLTDQSRETKIERIGYITFDVADAVVAATPR